jgi:predicted metal-dependent phosphoesterase TrpH
MKLDLHIHSKYSSDGILEPVRIIRTAIKTGLGGIAITDHNTVKGGIEAKQYETDELMVIVGSEVKTERGEIIGLFLSQEINSRNARDVASEIKSQGGIVIIPHPFDKLRHSAFHPTEDDLEFIDAIEVYNSRAIFNSYNREAMEFAGKHNLPVVAGSDAHFANEIGNAGIIIEGDDIRGAILGNYTKIFGKRSPLMNHVGTKVLKAWRFRRVEHHS